MTRAQNSFLPEEIEVIDQLLAKASSGQPLGDLRNQDGFSGALRKLAAMKRSVEKQKEKACG